MKRQSIAKFALTFLGSLICMFQSAQAEDEFVYILRARGNPYWREVRRGIEDAARSKRVKALVYQTASETDAEEQLAICYTAIQRKPVVIAISAAATGVGLECLKRAAAAGIVVAEIDSTISLEDAESAGVPLAFSLGSDNRAIGQLAAAHAADLLSGRKSQILVLEGAAGSLPGRQRVEGFRDELRSKAPHADIVQSISADWDRLKALNTTVDVLQRVPDLTLIYAANDSMALGAVEAVKMRRSPAAPVAVIGVDGTADAREAIRQGTMSSSVAQAPYAMGRRALELSLLKKQGAFQRELIPARVLTADVVKQESSDSGR